MAWHQALASRPIRWARDSDPPCTSTLLSALVLYSSGTGQSVLDLPVSTAVSVKGGEGISGMPKHRAHLDERKGLAWVSALYDLCGQMVSRFDVRRPRGFPLPRNMGPSIIISVAA
jgi:hypothetical protein